MQRENKKESQELGGKSDYTTLGKGVQKNKRVKRPQRERERAQSVVARESAARNPLSVGGETHSEKKVVENCKN